MTALGGQAELVSAGKVLLRYTMMPGSPPTADEAMPIAEPRVVVPEVLAQLPGWRIATSDSELASALAAAGCRPVRHAHVYSRDLLSSPPDGRWRRPDVGGLQLEALHAPTADLIDLLLAAYPPGHPDSETSDPEIVGRDLHDLLTGRVIGPLLDASRRLVDGSRAVALVVINRMPGVAPMGGPWVSDICRLPGASYRGLGTVLLKLAMAELAATGESSLSLAVTDGNPARATYERLDFRHVQTSWKLQVPPE